MGEKHVRAFTAVVVVVVFASDLKGQPRAPLCQSLVSQVRNWTKCSAATAAPNRLGYVCSKAARKKGNSIRRTAELERRRNRVREAETIRGGGGYPSKERERERERKREIDSPRRGARRREKRVFRVRERRDLHMARQFDV